MNRKNSWLPVASSGANPQLVEDHQVDAEHGVDDAIHRVVGQPTVERLHQIRGSEVADAQARLHGGVADTNKTNRSRASPIVPATFGPLTSST